MKKTKLIIFVILLFSLVITAGSINLSRLNVDVSEQQKTALESIGITNTKAILIDCKNDYCIYNIRNIGNVKLYNEQNETHLNISIEKKIKEVADKIIERQNRIKPAYEEKEIEII